MNKDIVRKAVVLSVIFLFIGVGVYPTIATKIDNTISKTLVYDGTLSGFVYDTFSNPIEGALVRVHFHETFEEAYSGEDGYYFVDNTPICYCYKNATCSKEGYKTEWVLLGIYENTKYDFVLTTSSPYGMDLSCDEPYKNVKQGDTTIFIVEITNTGALDDTYDVTASSIEDIECLINGVYADQYTPYIISLGAGESTSFEVTAEVGESVPKDEWIIFVFAFSQNDTNVHYNLHLTSNVISDYGVDLSCDDPYQNVRPGDTATYVVEITNTGMLDDTYELVAGPKNIAGIFIKINGFYTGGFNPYIVSLSSSSSEILEVTVYIGSEIPEYKEWFVVIFAESQNDTEVCNELVLTVNVIGTGPPTPPRPSGPPSGKVGEEYEYWIVAPVDPDGDAFSYLFCWGDGTSSEWLGSVPGGYKVSASHTWTKKGFYEVKIKAKDEFGVESPWSDPLSVTMLRNKAISVNSLFLKLLEKFPLLAGLFSFPIFTRLLNLK